MREKVLRRIVLGAVLLLGTGALGVGIKWGLPSKSVDGYFFSADSTVRLDSRQAYQLSGAGVAHVTGDAEGESDHGGPMTLIENRAQASGNDAIARARILKSFRLNSFVPEERLTLDAVTMLQPEKGQFDPKMYRYGGLWVYPMWGLAKLASGMNLVQLSPDIGFYVDRPEEAGRFYVLARACSAAWGLAAVAAVFSIVWKLTGSTAAAAVAGLGFIAMPVVLTTAHEGQPQLAGAAMMLMAILAAMNYVESGRVHWMMLTAAACGMAAGMDLWEVTGVLLIPLMALARGDGAEWVLRDVVFGVIIAATIYFAANPSVAEHLMNPQQREQMGWNVQTLRTMNPIGSVQDSAISAVKLMAAATSLPMAIAGGLGILLFPLSFRSTGDEEDPREQFSEATLAAAKTSDEAGMIWAMGLLALIQFAVFAAGKPADYAQRGVFCGAILLIASISALQRMVERPVMVGLLGLVLVAATGVYGWTYEKGFLRDATDQNTRLKAALVLEQALDSYGPGAHPSLAVMGKAEPYCMPPVDLFGWRIMVVPGVRAKTVMDEAPDATVSVVDTLGDWSLEAAPISWANRPFIIGQDHGAQGKKLSTYIAP